MPEEPGRSVTTAYDLYSHLLDLGQTDLAMNVLYMAMEAKGEVDGSER